ncbi:MAG: His/Gly/Thr/Pro-type tRNA ligase C-terminal domain-containing protein, partial [Atopobiaceae bacterium]|nr:His/Gly/Thr/Pro-type tRNA ligase C-terminal domain-containing protein [Atopobiaceae bacterium]
SLKSQFKQADKLHARLCVVIGPDEVAAGEATLRDMDTHEQVQVPFESLADAVKARLA